MNGYGKNWVVGVEKGRQWSHGCLNPSAQEQGHLLGDALADILTTLADRIRTGTVKFDQGATSVDLGFPASVRLDVEIKETPKPTGTKHGLELSMWLVTSLDGEPTPSGGIAIS